MFSISRQPSRPEIGLIDGRLRPCPDCPNCVSSQEEGEDCHIDPLPADSSATQTMKRLVNAIAAMPDATIVTQSATYLHVEFKSRVMRFVDDVEFLVDVPNELIHVRSASRLGYSDMGVNRRRVEAIRERLSTQ